MPGFRVNSRKMGDAYPTMALMYAAALGMAIDPIDGAGDCAYAIEL